MRTLSSLLAFAAASFVVAMIGCGGGDDASSPDDGNGSDAGSDSAIGASDASSDGTADAGSIADASTDAAPAPFVSLIGRSTTMPAGPVEGYKCTTIVTTAPMDITAFHVEATAGIIEATLTAGASGAAGDFDCDPGSLGGQLLYAFSAGTSELDFPADTAMHVEPQSLVLNLHLDNETASTANDTVDVKIRTMSTTPIQLAQAFYVGTRSITLPADGITHMATGGCSFFPTALKIFAVTPMMYKSAQHATLTSKRASTTTTIYDGDFDFANQAMHAVSPAFAVKGGDQVELQCSYVNNTGATLSFGDYTSSAEHCYAATYAYGIGSLGLGMFECAQ